MKMRLTDPLVIRNRVIPAGTVLDVSGTGAAGTPEMCCSLDGSKLGTFIVERELLMTVPTPHRRGTQTHPRGITMTPLQTRIMNYLASGPLPPYLLKEWMHTGSPATNRPGHCISALRAAGLIKERLVTNWDAELGGWIDCWYVYSTTAACPIPEQADLSYQDHIVAARHIAAHAQTKDPEWTCRCRVCIRARAAAALLDPEVSR